MDLAIVARWLEDFKNQSGKTTQNLLDFANQLVELVNVIFCLIGGFK